MQGDFFLLALNHQNQQELDIFISVLLEVEFQWLYIPHLKLHRQYWINLAFTESLSHEKCQSLDVPLQMRSRGTQSEVHPVQLPFNIFNIENMTALTK